MKPVENSNILFFHPKKQQWYIARDPLHALGTPDMIDGKDNSGTGPGMLFARTLADNSYIKTGLIPTAVGGAPIDPFGPDGELYNRSLMLTKKAIECSPVPTRLRAILWLQGESDAVEDRYKSYEPKLHDLVDRYRRDLKGPALPFIACTIGSFVHRGPFQYAEEINNLLLALPDHRQNTACIDARDLTGHIGDFLHYDLTSQEEIGKRFCEAYQALTQ
jgi:hypothetical protein